LHDETMCGDVEPCSAARALVLFFLAVPPPPHSTLFPYTTLFRSSNLSRHDHADVCRQPPTYGAIKRPRPAVDPDLPPVTTGYLRSEEHTSELQSRFDLVCRLLLEKKNGVINQIEPPTPMDVDLYE